MTDEQWRMEVYERTKGDSVGLHKSNKVNSNRSNRVSGLDYRAKMWRRWERSGKRRRRSWGGKSGREKSEGEEGS